MQKKLHLPLLAFGFWLIALTGFAQTFPVTISTQIQQPSPIYLSNYADATTTNSPIKTQLILNDLTISNRQVRLKYYIQGNGISLVTNDFVIGAQPLYLDGGFPLQLTNIDLAPYFEFQNIQGINPNQYAQPLPEGIYTISTEVYDFATNKKLSKKSSVTTIIFQNEPPLLNLPLNNASIMQQNIQNIVFSWTPRQINVSNVEYQFDLVEIWDPYTPVQNAFAYSPPIYSATTRNTTLQYSISEPQLIPGKKYAWRIKAKALAGAEELGVFKNNGYSEIFAFTYEVYCTAPLQITTEGISSDQAKISWFGSIDNYDYQISYREKNADSDWYNVVTAREYITLTNLKPNAIYEYTIGSACALNKYTHSTIHEFMTLAKDEITFAGCGIPPDPKDLANKTPLPALLPNDVVTAGDFPIVVLHSSGSNGTFSGDGYVTLPFLAKFKELIDAADKLSGQNEKGEANSNIGEYTRIRITFNNIGVNTDFKLISGEIIASYDPNWGSMADLDGIVNDVFGDTGNVVNRSYDFEIATVVKNEDGTITITSTTGVISKLEKTPNDIIITDKEGKQFTVAANAPAGNIETSGKVAPGGIPTSKNTNGMSSGGSVAQISSEDVEVVFKTSGFYSYDTAPEKENGSLNKTYETVPTKNGGKYAIPYKAVSDVSGHDTDFVVANVILRNGKTKEDLVFKTQNGTEIKPDWTGDEVKLPLKRTLDYAKETIIATVKPAKSKDTLQPVGKYDIAGTINLWHLTHKKVNVTLVSINGAIIPSKAQEELNAIYEPAGITFEVNTINVELKNTWGTTIKNGDSDLLNTYTDVQQDITQALLEKLGSNYKKDTYYMLFTKEKADNGYDGFMPLKRQFGFVFDGTTRTLAHELGHGVFGLQHPFVKFNTTTPTDLLMDYGKGTLLSHNDWEIIHAPGLQLYPFTQGSSDGASYKVVIEDKFLNLDKDPNDKAKGSFSFLSYHGEIISLNKNNLQQIIFNYGTIDYQGSGKQAPGVLQSFVIKENNISTLYQIDFEDGKYKNNKGSAYLFPDIKPEVIDGVIAFVPCGNDGKTYKFNKSNLSIYNSDSAKSSITSIDEFPFVPFSTKNKAIEVGGTKISQSFKLSDEGLRISFDQNTVDMSKDHCEKPELFYILKIAQIRKNYPEAFDKFTNISRWENPINNTINNASTSIALVPSNINIKTTYEWANYLGANTTLQTDYTNKTNLENYFKIMYQEFSKYIISANNQNDDFWKKLDIDTPVISILSQVKNESIVELEKKDINKKIIAIKTIQANWIVNEEHEEVLLKLFESTTTSQSKEMLKFLGEKSDGVPYLESFLSDIDNKYLFFGDDNRAKFVNKTIQIWSNSDFAKNGIQNLKTLLSKIELSPDENKKILERTINYNYKSIYSRFWTHIKSSNLPAYDDLYVKTVADYDTDNNKINIETLLALGFVSMSEIKKPVQFDPFEPILFTNNTTLTAFNEVSESKDNLFLPAFIVYYADKEAGIQTASDITQTAVDVTTLLIPGAQLSTIGKVLFYADKVSSVTSITARATAENNPEFSKIAGLVSLATGIASASTMVLKPSILKIDDYSNLLESINKSSNISAIAKEDRLLVEAFIEKTKSTLIAEGKFDGSMTLKYENAISKLRLGVNITNQESMVSRLIANYPKLENILAKTKNQLTFESATGVLKYNGKTIATITTDAKDVVLSTQKVTNAERTAANMEEFTEEAAIYCKGGNCDLVLGACFTGNTLVKTKTGLIPIKDIKEKDEVWSYSENTKTNRWSTVVQKVNLATKKLYQLVVGKDTLQATSEHPFYTKKGWINANLVTKGMMVLLANGTWNTVEANIPRDTITTVYNIEVLPAHTFYIGNEQVLVHNGFDCFKQKFKNLANASDEFFDDFRDNFDILAKFDKGELSYPAWQILKKEAPSLSKNIDEINLVSKNLDEINNVGGYTKWNKLRASLLTAGNKFIDDLLENEYINYLARKKAQGKPPRGRLDWKKTSDFWNLESPTALGKTFEKNAIKELIAKSNAIKAKFFKLGINLDEYEIFQQIQIKTGNIIDDIEEYCIVDFLLVKKKTNEFGEVILDYNNTVALETKLNLGTDLSKGQKGALAKINSKHNTFDIRSKSQTGQFNENAVIGSNSANKEIKITDFIKVWSEGSGNTIADIKSLKAL